MEPIFLPHHHSEDALMQTLRAELDDREKFTLIAEIFAQLGDPNRVRLFWLLCHCEECVINLAAMMDMTSPALSHHLRLLRQSGLIVSRRCGKEVYYRAAPTQQAQLLHEMMEKVMEIACPK